jgi:hypothetical protein
VDKQADVLQLPDMGDNLAELDGETGHRLRRTRTLSYVRAS